MKSFTFSTIFLCFRTFFVFISRNEERKEILYTKSINGNNSIRKIPCESAQNDVNKLPHFTTPTHEPDMSNKRMVLFGKISLMMELVAIKGLCMNGRRRNEERKKKY